MSGKFIFFGLTSIICLLINGCTQRVVEKDFIHEVNFQEREKISGAVLTSGESIEFGKDGGRFFYLKDRIVGCEIPGQVLNIPLDAVTEIRTKVYPVLGTPVYNLDTGSIIELIDTENRLFRFRQSSVKFNPADNEFSGILSDGSGFKIPLNKVKNVFDHLPEIISNEELRSADTIRIVQVVIDGRTVVSFNDPGASFFSEELPVLIGFSSTGRLVSEKAEDILYVNIEKVSHKLTFFAALGIVVGLGVVAMAVAAAAKESCPFIYSYNGHGYTFDAEPLGGATSKILERSELSRLHYLRDSCSIYKIFVTNEVQETQYINSMNLIIADHKPGESVYPDNSGNLYKIISTDAVYSAYDGNGTDILKFIRYNDNIHWQSVMPADSTDIQMRVRDNLKFSLPRHNNTDTAALVINAGTTLWGSNMIREMLLLRGDKVDEWYSSVDSGGKDYTSMMSYLQNEELFQLRLYAETKTGWKEKALINGGGPFVSETRLVMFDISDVAGDTLNIRIDPPVGFWTLNYLAVAEDKPSEIKDYITLPLSKAYTSRGANVTDFLTTNDGKYYSMPDKSSAFTAEFFSPQLKDGLTRAIFANTTGYYKIHLPKDKHPDISMLYKLHSSPGEIVRYSNLKFHEFRKSFYKSNLTIH